MNLFVILLEAHTIRAISIVQNWKIESIGKVEEKGKQIVSVLICHRFRIGLRGSIAASREYSPIHNGRARYPTFQKLRAVAVERSFGK